MTTPDREPQMQRCEVCGSERTLLAYRVGGDGAEITCLDAKACRARLEARNA